MPCPSCGAGWAYHTNNADEWVRQRALRVSELGCECGACRAFWPPDEFHWLEKLIGCTSPLTA